MLGADSKPRSRAQCRPEKSEEKIQSRNARPWRCNIKEKKEGEYTRQRGQMRKNTWIEISQTEKKHLLGLCWELAGINILGPKSHAHRSDAQAR